MIKLAVTMRPIEKGVSGSGFHLHRLLSAFVQEARDFELFFLHHTDADIDLYRFGRSIKVSRNPWIAAFQLRRMSFDIVHYSPLSLFSALGVRTRFRCATLHPDDELIIPEYYPIARRLHARHWVGHYARKMDRIFTVSRTSADLLRECYSLDPERIVLTSNAADGKYRVLTSAELGDARERFVQGRRFVLHVSNFSERKNPWILLSAWGRVARLPQFEDLCFVIVGNGWRENPAVERAAREAGLSGRLRLTGFVEELDIPRLMNLAEVFIFPSLSEGFGMPNLEAMACGCAVITSDAFAIPEVVGDAAIVLRNKHDSEELAATIERVLSDVDLRARLRSKGLKRAQDFSWEQSARNLQAGYRSLFGATAESRRNGPTARAEES